MQAREGEASPELRRTLGGRRTAMRMLQVRSVGMMVVYEQDPTTDATARELVFESAGEKVRLTAYPQDWHRLSDEQLDALRQARA